MIKWPFWKRKIKGRLMRDEILLLLLKEGRMNTTQIARRIGKIYQNVRACLFRLKAAGLVDSEHVKRFIPGLTWILMNEWWITNEGKRWLKRRKLL